MKVLQCTAVIFGQISVFDSQTDSFPVWDDNEISYSRIETAISVQTRNLEQGDVCIRVLSDQEAREIPLAKTLIFDGNIKTTSRVLRFGDAHTTDLDEISVPSDLTRIEIRVDALESTSSVDVIIQGGLA